MGLTLIDWRYVNDHAAIYRMTRDVLALDAVMMAEAVRLHTRVKIRDEWMLGVRRYDRDCITEVTSSPMGLAIVTRPKPFNIHTQRDEARQWRKQIFGPEPEWPTLLTGWSKPDGDNT